FLAKACQYLAAGTVYAVFAATGTVGTVLMDTFLLGTSISVGMMACMALILIGVIGLNLSDPSDEEESHG
ncbi:MAG: DMT family transporter, partial [Wohlfahrtiimonas sp.]